MADKTARLGLAYIQAAQAQKHITHNDALRLLDGIVQASVVDRTTSTPPGAPSEGDTYIVAASATGVWAGWEGDLALYVDGSWYRLVAVQGMRVWDLAADELVVRIGSSWTSLAVAMGFLAQAESVNVAVGANGGATGVGVLEETLSGLSGTSVDSTIDIPDRAICLGVSTRTVTAVTGATSYDCGVSGSPAKFGGTLGVAQGSTNKGVIGPEAFYADTPVRLTANGGNFTGGAVRIAIHYLEIEVPG
ncbi:DUF2793 domain-containing protein [Sulfitobacter sp. 1A12126]|uniref:DUF2793 domain-containing protein n=1 Tax=Sulfitobacter sp. 1A12126 TaxID=3368591 RepID=UPI003745ADE2